MGQTDITGKFTDAKFKEWVHGKIGKTEGEPIFDSDMAKLNLSDVDVSCMGIKSLDGIEYFKDLTVLECPGNELTELTISDNPALKKLICANNKLRELDVSKNAELTDLHCSDNELTALDVSKNTALMRLWCSNNLMADESAVVGFKGSQFSFEPQRKPAVK